jgi:hypothetical protein
LAVFPSLRGASRHAAPTAAGNLVVEAWCEGARSTRPENANRR